MSRVLRATVALGALTGLLATTALGAATAAHVALEHEGPVRSAHSHHSDADDHAHGHESAGSPTDHSHTATGEIDRSPVPEHRHVAALVADVQGRTARATSYPVAGGAADAPAAVALMARRSPVGPASRAGPVARSALLCRRSVVLQV
jgi:hypothetical protein